MDATIHDSITGTAWAGIDHFPFYRAGVVDVLDHVCRPSQGNRNPALYQGCCFTTFPRCNQVEGPEFIIWTPSAPIRKFFLPILVLLLRDKGSIILSLDVPLSGVYQKKKGSCKNERGNPQMFCVIHNELLIIILTVISYAIDDVCHVVRDQY